METPHKSSKMCAYVCVLHVSELIVAILYVPLYVDMNVYEYFDMQNHIWHGWDLNFKE